MPKPKYQEPNLLQRYSSPGNALYIVSEESRLGFLRGECKRFNKGLLKRAREEYELKRRAYDASTYPFVQDDLTPHVYYEGSGVFMLVQGTFYGKNDVKSVIPIDLSANIPDLFRRDIGNETIDDLITKEKVEEFIEAHRGYLSKSGYMQFEISNSSFFYLKKSDLEGLLKKDGELDMTKLKQLVPFLVSTDYVVLDKVKTPTLEGYLNNAPVHMSYRLKKSLTSSMLDKLSAREGGITLEGGYNGKSQGVMVDLRGFQVIVNSMDEVKECQKFLEGSPKIGKSKINYLYPKDYYKHPGGSAGGTDFKAIKIVAEVQTRGFEPCITEFQIIRREEQWVNLHGSGKTSHREHEKKREHEPRKVKDIRGHYEHIFNGIFGTGELTILIKAQ